MKKLMFMAVAACLVMAGCSSDEPENREPVVTPKPAMSAVQSRAAEQMKGFDLDFFQAYNAQTSGENFVVSPLSMSMLLSMAANTADEAGAAEIAAALGEADTEALNALAKNYSEWLPVADSGVKLAMANSVWYSDRFTINPSFSAIAADSYGAGIFSRNFSQGQKLMDDVNAWTSKQTNGLIPTILDEVPDNLRAILLNAMYFKGQWYEPLDKNNTKDYKFKGKETTGTVQMMQSSSISYYSTEKYQSTVMWFSRDMFYVQLILPRENVDVDEFIKSEEFKDINEYKHNYGYNVYIGLPRFKIEPPRKGVDLEKTLSALGINNIFEPHANNIFTPATEMMFKIYQKATIEFNEDGAEAAAVSEGEGLVTSPGPVQEQTKDVTMVLDRPFIFMVREALTDRCLFAGKVANL